MESEKMQSSVQVTTYKPPNLDVFKYGDIQSVSGKISIAWICDFFHSVMELWIFNLSFVGGKNWDENTNASSELEYYFLLFVRDLDDKIYVFIYK